MPPPCAQQVPARSAPTATSNVPRHSRSRSGLPGGCWIRRDTAGSRALHSVGEQATAWECAALGSELAIAAESVALLVMADGSARRGPKAPGHLDGRSVPFDAEVERAIRAGDMAALLALDADLARELMATGRPAWQVLAGALAGRQPASGILYSGDPFGVAYLVASLTPVAEGTGAGWQHGG